MHNCRYSPSLVKHVLTVFTASIKKHHLLNRLIPFGKTHRTPRGVSLPDNHRWMKTFTSPFSCWARFLRLLACCSRGSFIRSVFGDKRAVEDGRGRRPAHPGENYPRPSPARHTVNSRRCGGCVWGEDQALTAFIISSSASMRRFWTRLGLISPDGCISGHFAIKLLQWMIT